VEKLNYKKEELLKNHTSFGIGGPADLFVEVQNKLELLEAISYAKVNNLNFFILGGGTNILFGDKGYRGLVIKNKINFLNISHGFVEVSSGYMMPVFVHNLIVNNKSGLENFLGLPGTVGGAVYGNAGCNGIEIKDVLIEAEIIDLITSEVKTVDNSFFDFSYRESKLKKTKDIVLSAKFKIGDGIDNEYLNQLKEKVNILRKEKQPSGKTNGSFFKNPSKDFPAGMLVDKLGLKGKIIGGVKISEVHGNFFINFDNGSAKDVLELSDFVCKKVKETYGFELEKEVQLVGEF